MYSIFPLAVFPGPLTTFSSINGWTVCAKMGVEESKKRRHTARKVRLPGRCPNVNEKLTLASIQLTVWLAPGCSAYRCRYPRATAEQMWCQYGMPAYQPGYKSCLFHCLLCTIVHHIMN